MTDVQVVAIRVWSQSACVNKICIGKHSLYPRFMTDYQFTEYFENEVLRKRRYLKKEWCIFAVENAVHSEPQEHNRHRFWAPIPELGDRYLRVITLEDKVTIHNAFPDRGFKL